MITRGNFYSRDELNAIGESLHTLKDELRNNYSRFAPTNEIRLKMELRMTECCTAIDNVLDKIGRLDTMTLRF